MPRVFVVQDSGKNLTPAREHGEMEIMLQQHDPCTTAASIKLKDKLRDFHKDDYLLLIGHPVLIGIAMHTAMLLHGYVNCLVWDRDHYRYNVVIAE